MFCVNDDGCPVYYDSDLMASPRHHRSSIKAANRFTAVRPQITFQISLNKFLIEYFLFNRDCLLHRRGVVVLSSLLGGAHSTAVQRWLQWKLIRFGVGAVHSNDAVISVCSLDSSLQASDIRHRGSTNTLCQERPPHISVAIRGLMLCQLM